MKTFLILGGINNRLGWLIISAKVSHVGLLRCPMLPNIANEINILILGSYEAIIANLKSLRNQGRAIHLSTITMIFIGDRLYVKSMNLLRLLNEGLQKLRWAYQSS